MFTGIVEEIGEVTAVAPSGDGVRLTVRAPKAVSDAAHGDSISVSGVCLTVVDQGADWFTADVMKQTLDMSTLAGVARRPRRQPRAGDAAHGRLGGHIVQGHIDGTGEVLEVRRGAQWRVLRISLPAGLAPLVVDKGSIARRRRVPHRQRRERPERRRDRALARGFADPRDTRGHDARRARRGRPRQHRDRHPGAPRPAPALFHDLPPPQHSAADAALLGRRLAMSLSTSPKPSKRCAQGDPSSSPTTRTARTKATSSCRRSSPRPSGSPGPCAGRAASSARRCPPSGRTASTCRRWSRSTRTRAAPRTR